MPSKSGNLFDFGGGVNFNPGANAMDFRTPGLGSGNDFRQVTTKGINLGNLGGTGAGEYPPSLGTLPAFPGQGTGGNRMPNYGLYGFGGGSGGTNNPSLTGSTLPFYTGTNPSGNLSQAFGPLGPFLLDLIKTGGYNPQVFQALVAQLQPEIQRGVATIGANTGASGTRFGSGYDLALGDYLSQVNLQEQGLAAGLYEQAVQTSAGALESALNPLAQFTSNKGGFTTALLSSLIGALGPSLINKIPGLGSNSGSNTTSSPDWTTLATLGIPDTGNLPTTVGTPTGIGGGNVTDPFGTGGIFGSQQQFPS